MLIIWYITLGAGTALSCFLAFTWLKFKNRKSAVLSMIAGAAAGQVWCLNLSWMMSGIVSLFFALLFILVVFQTEDDRRVSDVTAALCICAAANGTVQMTGNVILYISELSLFFRGALLAICVLTGVHICHMLSAGFPGRNWADYLENNSIEDGERRITPDRLTWIFVVYALSCVVPLIASIRSLAVLLSIWFVFIGGLALIDLLLSDNEKDTRIKAEKHYRNEMQTYMSVIRSQRHDYNFHVQTVQGLFSQKDYEACKAYLDELRKDSVEMNRILPLADAAVSALILSFQNQASQKNIPMSIMIENDLSQIATNEYETNKIIGNLLQNALDETENLADRSGGIRLSVIKRGEFAVISVSNPTREKIPMASYKVGHSSKKGHEGIGISSIQALAAKYGGVVYSRMEDDRICFVAKIPLHLVN